MGFPHLGQDKLAYFVKVWGHILLAKDFEVLGVLQGVASPAYFPPQSLFLVTEGRGSHGLGDCEPFPGL